jgi:hypothetical protein
MPRKEVTKYAETYFELNRALEGYNIMALAAARAAAYTAQTSDPYTLPPEKVVQEIDLLEQANALHMLYGLWLIPGLTNQQVFAYSGLANAESLRQKFPEAYAFTQRDLDSANTMLHKTNTRQP